MKTPLTIDFRHPAASEHSLAGGKGTGLAKMTLAGFPVPDGFVITTAAHELWVAEMDIAPGDSPAIHRAAVEDLAFPPEVAVAIEEALHAFPPNTRFAVRSSGTLEDLGNAAFAGQHETILEVARADILPTVKACWVSFWSDRAVAYRQHRGMSETAASMAVVVQEMVDCEVAGVAFSLHPVSGHLDQVVIDANFGLGESVVSGSSEIDHWEIDKGTGAVLLERIGQKQSTNLDLSPEQASQACLDANQIAAVAGLACKVESACGFPQDIEWGIHDGELFLLQARPVTIIPPRWTRDESAERFPAAMTPLTWDFVRQGFHESLAWSFELMELPAYEGEWFSWQDHYIYGNQNAVELYLNRMQLPVRSLEEIESHLDYFRARHRWVRTLPQEWQRDLDHYLMRIGGFMAEPLGGRSAEELWVHICEINALGAWYFRPNIAISITQSALYKMLGQLLLLAHGPADAECRLLALTATCNTLTGQVNRSLLELANFLRRDLSIYERLLSCDSREIIETNSLAEWPEFQAAFQDFLQQHGHREIEFDIYQPTWVELPWVVLDHIRQLAEAEPPSAEKDRNARVEALEIERELFAALPTNLHLFARELLRLTQDYTALDDLEHYQTTRLILPLRRGVRALGERLQSEGLLEDPMDLFFVRMEDIAALLQGSMAERLSFSALVKTNRAAYLSARERSPGWEPGRAGGRPTGQDMSGIPGSPGVVEGEIYLVRGADDFAGFPHGAILVARTTNPAWTPLFYRAAAVLTESGGPLSHGAVTAREVGVPAIMAVPEIMTRLENGMRVRVDGSTGALEILPPVEPCLSA